MSTADLFEETDVIKEPNLATDLEPQRYTYAETPVSPTPAMLIQQAIAAGIPFNDLTAYDERQQALLAADAWGDAVAAFQAKCPPIKKERLIDLGGGKGPQYAAYDDIDEIVRPLMAEFGLSKRFDAKFTDDGKMRVRCCIRHKRHEEWNEVELPMPTQLRVNDSQKGGAAISFGKRYALCAALDIVVTDQDTDGEGLCETISEEQIANLNELIEATDTDLKRFLNWLALEKLSDMSVEQFPVAIRELKRKAAKR